MTHLEQWHPFNERYGVLRTSLLQSSAPQPAWKDRHTGDQALVVDYRCLCPGLSLLFADLPGPPRNYWVQCAQRSTHEDQLCEECRTWCRCRVTADGESITLAEAARRRISLTIGNALFIVPEAISG